MIVNWFLDEITMCLILTSGIGARLKLQKPHVGGGIIRVCNNVIPQTKKKMLGWEFNAGDGYTPL